MVGRGALAGDCGSGCVGPWPGSKSGIFQKAAGVSELLGGMLLGYGDSSMRMLVKCIRGRHIYLVQSDDT